MPDDLRAVVAALTARMDDVVDCVTRVQSTVTQSQIQIAQTIIEVRAVVQRLDLQNGSISEAFARLNKIEHRCDRHEDESESRKLEQGEVAAIRAALSDIQVQKRIDDARATGASAVWANLRPWIERAAVVILTILAILVLEHGRDILPHVK